ncbi:MAG: MBL fold metallo-hydrolase [Ancalomicrobiaceae bacterium]|nr:MBL fold metallo-hydrolase [Ancalomicrobiaceae bacterium]
MSGAGKNTITFRVLGCGSSPGVPRIGNDWGRCDPKNPKNRRRRASLLITRASAHGLTRVLIDSGPDVREQMLDAEVDWVDAVFYTHPHADHIHGIDDLRSFVLNRRRMVDVYADQTTSDRLRDAFGYCFVTPPGSSYPPMLVDHRLVPGKPATVDGPGGPITLVPYEQQHGDIVSLGFRIGNVAYSPDVSDFNEAALPHLEDLDLWILDALREKPHPSHFSLAEALEWIGRMQPRRAILTHMHIDLDYEAVRASVPAGVEPAYDGMEIAFEV